MITWVSVKGGNYDGLWIPFTAFQAGSPGLANDIPNCNSKSDKIGDIGSAVTGPREHPFLTLTECTHLPLRERYAVRDRVRVAVRGRRRS